MCIATYQKNKLDLLLQIELLVLRFEISLHQSTVCNGATVEGVVLFRFRFCEDDKKSSLIIPPICLLRSYDAYNGHVFANKSMTNYLYRRYQHTGIVQNSDKYRQMSFSLVGGKYSSSESEEFTLPPSSPLH